MKIQGQILSETDITTKSRTNPNTGEVTKSAVVRFLTFEPTEIIDVRVSDEMVKGGVLEALPKFIGKPFEVTLAYRAFSFADDNGKHVSMSGFHLIHLPSTEK
ncbi:hypothetical protein BCT30_20820 [Enterovibrio norvegicus]|uniref:hypothetical protein n=1 Tax=Enterovibrio norvegicus TaxID=188144 RepID=UPI000C867EFE|nr:hypothetical protein [Enterovibrio norvegicus]MCC4798670.1 hypothetical protein [Enterovibrio norvegicus]PMI36875.1 hypothetical protein BCU46_12850 [Enterovibrio norvegicus]PMN47493.1 hypothetical protein BCT30_20820 [Enterovibrio norvegicus]